MSHITIAASAKSVTQLFYAVRDNFTFSKSDIKNFGPFSASYSITLHLEGGTVTLNDDDTIEVQDMDIVFDSAMAQICFNLPGFCVGGWCIIPDPFDGCWVSLPKFCIGGPICIGPNLSGILTSEVSDVKAGVVFNYFVDPARTPSETDYEAELAHHPNQWQLFLNPSWVLVDPIDVAPTVANLIEQAIKDAINNIFWWVPSWAMDLLWALIGPVLDLFKSLLGIVGDIAEWLSNLLGNTFNLLGLIETAIAQWVASLFPLWHFEDPYPILQQDGPLIPVKIPIRNPAVTIDSHEMVVTADVGA